MHQWYYRTGNGFHKYSLRRLIIDFPKQVAAESTHLLSTIINFGMWNPYEKSFFESPTNCWQTRTFQEKRVIQMGGGKKKIVPWFSLASHSLSFLAYSSLLWWDSLPIPATKTQTQKQERGQNHNPQKKKVIAGKYWGATQDLQKNTCLMMIVRGNGWWIRVAFIILMQAQKF